jgi:hypothetical protein
METKKGLKQRLYILLILGIESKKQASTFANFFPLSIYNLAQGGVRNKEPFSLG